MSEGGQFLLSLDTSGGRGVGTYASSDRRVGWGVRYRSPMRTERYRGVRGASEMDLRSQSFVDSHLRLG